MCTAIAGRHHWNIDGVGALLYNCRTDRRAFFGSRAAAEIFQAWLIYCRSTWERFDLGIIGPVQRRGRKRYWLSPACINGQWALILRTVYWGCLTSAVTLQETMAPIGHITRDNGVNWTTHSRRRDGSRVFLGLAPTIIRELVACFKRYLWN